MIKVAALAADNKHYRCQNVLPSKKLPSLADDVLTDLFSVPRSIPCKYFYDAYGSDLFDQICNTQEYYQTRMEAALLNQYAFNIIANSEPHNIIELGSGKSRKTRYLLDACENQCFQPIYWPFDVCEPVVQESAFDLIDRYDWLEVNGLIGDYNAGLENFPAIDGRCLYIFLGGTLGNFNHNEAIEFLQSLKKLMSEEDLLLIGVDRVKDTHLLNAAYNDSQGITANFNLNILTVMNRELSADFDLQKYSHKAIYNEDSQQIEMYLKVEQTHDVYFGKLNESIRFNQGEFILTEISRKFTTETLSELFRCCGFSIKQHYEAPEAHFSLMLLSL